MGPQRIEQRHGKAFRDEIRKEILPVMPCRLHRNQRVGGVPHHCSQLPIALGIFLERCGRRQHGPILSYDRNDMPFSSNINPHVPHSAPLRREDAGASEPVLMLTLVHARTVRPPQDTVRALNTGRGRHSTRRGQRGCL